MTSHSDSNESIRPRPYQVEAITAVERGFREFDRQLVVMPTGAGKTCVFAWLAERRLPGRTLVLAHRDELIDQAIKRIRMTTGIHAEKEKAEWSATLSAQCVVASVQTMTRRLDRWPSDHFSLIVADEAHHAISDSWQRVLSHFDAQCLGFTATPDRGDKRSLGCFFENVAIDIPLLRLIQEGFLCPITIKSIPLQIDLSEVHMLAGDFSDQELGHVLEPFLLTIAEAVKEHASGRRTLAFLPLIDTSLKFAAACNQVGLHAKHVDGGSKDRQEALARFEAGEFDLLSNAMLLTEGYDHPAIDCVLVLRPTKSRPLFAQCCGRGTRIWEGKDNLLLLDFLWLHEKHRIVHPADLLAQDEEEADEITALVEDLCRRGASEEQLSLLSLANDVAQAREDRLRDLLRKLADRKAKYISAEEFCLQNKHVEVAFYQETMRWEFNHITEGQAKYLEEAKIDLDTVRGRGHASALLDLYFKQKDLQLATPKQRWLMRQHGIPNADKATRADARAFFARLNAAK